MPAPTHALELDLASSGSAKGQELARQLVGLAKKVGQYVRSTLNESCVADLENYLVEELSRPISITQVEYVYSAAIAGGTYAVENLPSRLKRISPDLSVESVAKICSEIEALIANRKSIIDSTRITTNSVTSIFNDLSDDKLISDSERKKRSYREYDEIRRKLMARKIGNLDEFMRWIEDCVALYRNLSELRSEELRSSKDLGEPEPSNLISARRKKGFVSTRSIDTYEKRIGDFLAEFVTLNGKSVGILGKSLMREVEPHIAHKSNIDSVKLIIEENTKSESKLKYLKSLKHIANEDVEMQIQELEHFIDGRPVKISFSQRIVSESIDQVLNSLKAQLAAKKNGSHDVFGKAKHRIGNSSLLIEVPGMKKSDIEEIAVVLKLIQKNR